MERRFLTASHVECRGNHLALAALKPERAAASLRESHFLVAIVRSQIRQERGREGKKRRHELTAPAHSAVQFVHRLARTANFQFASAIRRAKRADRTPLVGSEMEAAARTPSSASAHHSYLVAAAPLAHPSPFPVRCRRVCSKNSALINLIASVKMVSCPAIVKQATLPQEGCHSEFQASWRKHSFLQLPFWL